MKPLSAFFALALAAGAVALSAQQAPILPSEPPRGFGTSITGAYDGWFDNPDGSHTFLVGYLNRNRSLEVDVPIGPNNRIEPGGPDLGQPTHFMPGRRIGIFTVTVPKEFKPDQRLTWTLTVNGQTTSIPLKMNVDYNVSPFKIQHTATVTNTPPVIRLEEKGVAHPGTDRHGLEAGADAHDRPVIASGPRRVGGGRRDVFDRPGHGAAHPAAAGDGQLDALPRRRQGHLRQGEAGDARSSRAAISASRSAASSRPRPSSARRESTCCR